ncbi:hypothetical protein ACFFF7_01625 [Novosphingobium aquiterrae]|uniref:Uncharacterized protein n=1 Tax=Novosphingobium aquiterrae TaxID=624388 RepID=A0ABV6PE49_9SPHN
MHAHNALLVCILVSLSLNGYATRDEARIEDRTLENSCDDVVVIGKIDNGKYQHVSNPDDLIGHGWFDATISVRKVVRGPRLPKVIPVRYFAHTYMREDREFMFVLNRTENGILVIRTGQTTALRPTLSTPCE